MEESLRRALQSYRPTAEPANAREAAVSVLLAGRDLSVLLIRRAEHAGDPWSGHMALPGGRRDPSDTDLEATVTRETREEVGVDLSAVELWGTLPTVSAHARNRAPLLRVTPFVFRAPELPAVSMNEEVAETLWVPLRDLASGKLDGQFDYDLDGSKLTFPCWNVSGRIVWGLTHRILRDIVTSLRLP